MFIFTIRLIEIRGELFFKRKEKFGTGFFFFRKQNIKFPFVRIILKNTYRCFVKKVFLKPN